MKKLSLILTMVLFVVGFAFAQRTISGTVMDPKGTPVIGASVLAKGTKVGTVTDIDGKYSLSVPATATALTFSLVGQKSEEVTLGASNVIDVTMKEDNSILNEVIVTGTGVSTNRTKTSVDVQTLGSKGMPPAPSASVDQALIGKIAGAQISSVNGTPGSKVSILLRGINTINRGTSPMILMDGVELGATDLNTIDLNTIDKVEVVQGATAASIYGAQGANGVIQLFTKKGKNGQLNIDFSTSYAQNQYLNIGDVRKANLHGFNTNANNEVIGGSGKPLVYDNSIGAYSENVIWNSTDPTVQINKPYDKNLAYIDHFDMFFKSAPTSNNSLSISGGKENFDFLISASHNYQKSNLLNNGDYKRSNLTANLGVELFKGFKIRSITQLGYTNSSINDGGGNSTIYAAFNSRPFLQYDKLMDNGSYSAYQGDAGGVNGLNPYFINQYSKSDEQKIDIVQNFSANYQPFKWLELDAKYGLNYKTRSNIYTYENQSQNPNVQDQQAWWYNWNSGAPDGEINNYQYKTRFTNFLTAATFRFDLGSMIKSSTYVAFDYRNSLDQAYRTYGLGLPTYTPYTLKDAGTPRVVEDAKTPFVTFGYVVSQKFDIGEFAGVTGGFRSDYSSAFGGGSKPFTFPTGNAYLRLSALDFWKNSSLSNIIPEFKLRGGFGKAGIQPKPFDRYVTLSTVNIGGTNAFYLPAQQSNPDLNVEVSQEIEIGADFSVKTSSSDWLNTITFSPTYWKRETQNAIWDVDFIPSTGIGTYKDNSFSLGSNGFQFIATLQVADKKDFSWKLTTNFGKQTSEITKVQGPPVVLLTAAGSTGYVLQEGLKIGQLFGYMAIHSVNELRPDNGQPFIEPASQGNYEVASNGWVVNKTTKAPYFSTAQFPFGDPNPKFNMSFINGFTFKNFLTLNVQLDWLNGSHLYNQTKEWMYRDGIHSDYQQPFTIGGQTGAWSAFYRGVYAESSRNGTKNYFYEDASFVRLRNVELIVDLGKALNIKVAKRVQLVLAGRNLWTKTNYTGMDPEVNSSNVYTANGGNSAWDRGTDHNTMPNMKSYQVGLNVGF